MSCRIFNALFLGITLVFLGVSACWASEPPPTPVLLVHGMAWELGTTDPTWGMPQKDKLGKVRWTGMVGYLEQRHFRFGGVIRPEQGKISLPENLHTQGVYGSPRKARLFLLEFSTSANTDGLAYKALELAEAIQQTCQYTGSKRVKIVTHSAGGLVARAYLQSALPGVEYRHDVERLITIGTPHLGSALASHFGDYLGTRATSIQPDAALIRELNDELELPDDTMFASIVVRGIAADARGRGKELDPLVDEEFLAKLPVEYRLGGDQVVHVRSQNLRLAKCAGRYEKRTGRPVQYALARVPDPSPEDRSPWETSVHVVSPSDPIVQHLVAGLLDNRALLWSRVAPERVTDWVAWQARLHVNGAIEAEAIRIHPMSEVSNIEIERFELIERDGLSRSYAFDGKAFSKNKLIRLRRRWTQVEGQMDFTFDRFGRVLASEASIE